MKIRADLHIHSCLSPCGSLEMSPTLIAERAASAGLEVVALTDHNSALNCRAFEAACRRLDLVPVFGMEVTSSEEAHILCLFESVASAEELGRLVYERLPDIPNNPDKSGDQVFVDSEENILGEVEKFLVAATDISIDELCEITGDLGGLFIPAHIDKPLFSIPSQLGFLPPMNYTAFETTTLPCPVETGEYSLILNSDAHYPDDISKRSTIYEVSEKSFRGLSEAITDSSRISYN